MAWLAGWDQRIELKIEDYANDIGAEVTWFPVTVFLTSTQGQEVFVELTTDAEYMKVAFTKADGTTELYAEKELFDVSEELGIYHISRDDWTINANTSIFLYYDKDHADNTTYIGAVGARTEVYDDNTLSNWNLADDDADTTVIDSTTNYDLTKKANAEPSQDTGKISFAQHFDGSDDYLTHATFLDTLPAALTFEFWFCPDITYDSGAGARQYLMRKWNDATADEYDWILIRLDDTVGDILIQNIKDGVVVTLNSTTVSWTGGTWYHIAYKMGSGGNELWVNGVSEDTDASTQMPNNGTYQDFGMGIDIRDKGEPFDGKIDGWKVSDTPRNLAWVKGSYNSGNDTLFTYGSEEKYGNVIFFGSNF